MARERKPLVTSLSATFKRKVNISEDVNEAKKEHRTNLKSLVDTYMEDVAKGKAEGIRNAKELVEVIKADMLLLGEATDRTENANSVDEARVQQISTILDDNDPNIQSLIDELFEGMNQVNNGMVPPSQDNKDR